MSTDQITEAILRYHRKNPLRGAFGTDTVIAQNGADAVEQVYQQLEEEGLFEAIHHKVEREGKPRCCYRITKKGLVDVKK